MKNLSPALTNHLNCFNGTIESLRPFLKAVNLELLVKKQTLELTENRVKKLLEHGSNGIALLNAQGMITYVTPAVLKTFGYTEDELLFSSNLQLGHPDEKRMLRAFLDSIMNEPGKTAEVIYRVKTKPGKWLWIKSQVTNMLHEKGIESLVFNYEDITENVLLQQERDFEKSNTEALINSTTDLMWSVDREMRLITANRPFLERVRHLHGVELRSGDTLIDPAWLSLNRAEKWQQRYLQALSGASFTVNDFFDAPGNGTWEETTFYPIYEKNEIKGVSCFLRNITEKKTAYELIRKNEALLATAQSIANFGSWECRINSAGQIIDNSLQWSDEVYRIFGLQQGRSDITLRKLHAAVHPHDLKFVQESLKNALQNNSMYDAEYRIIKPCGDIVWIRSIGKLVPAENDVYLKMIGTTQDITSKKIVEEEHTKLINDLLEKNKDHEQFAYVISHNLRGPVATIQGLTEIFKNYVPAESIEYKCASGIYQSALKVDEVIRDIHYILQVKKEISEKKTDVELADLVSDVSESIATYLEKQEGNIRVCFESHPRLFTIRGYLYSIFYNLIMNSLKYRRMEVAPHIHISSHPENGYCVLKFRDNGMGIDLPRFGNKLFTLYQRLHENIEGKGIGLYMVKSQVESLGGTIEVNSEVNAGAEFIIRLPIKQ